MKLAGMMLLVGAAVLSAQTIVIRNADVYPVSGAEMKGVSVLIRDGRIADIGAKVAAPKGAKVIEGKGLRVYPGMIDSGTELGLSEVSAVRETVDTGEIGEFMPQLRALVAVNPESEHFPVVRVNGITSVMTYPAGGRGGGTQLIAGQAAMINTDGWTWEDMEVSRSAGMHMIFPSLTPGRGGFGGGDGEGGGPAGGPQAFSQLQRNYQAQIQKLSDFFTAARNYQKAKTANVPGFKPDLKLDAMIPVLEGKVPLAISASRERQIQDAVKFAVAQKVKAVILQPRELGKAAADLKAANIPVIFGRVLALPNGEDDAYDQQFTLPLEAYKAGVKFAFGTFNNEFVRNLPYQAATAVAYGLPYEEALKAVTINAAQIWGVGDKIGSLQEGKVANLMVTDGDPLEIQTQVKHLIIKGKEVDLTNKQTHLYEKYLSRQ
jgi:imidazolonepropionase-like amidohydrolase